MNVIRCTVIDREGAVSFIARCEALAAITASCVKGPKSLARLLDFAEQYYTGLSYYVQSGLAVFDEHNLNGNHEAIHLALQCLPSCEHPVFRVVDDVTREASLSPANAGAVLFNLIDKRIVQIQNSYSEITRGGHGRIFDGKSFTDTIFVYRLPSNWSLVP